MALAPTPLPDGGPPPGGETLPAGPPGGTGSATASSAMAGVAHQGMAGVKAALELLQKSVGELPLGSPLHQKTLKYIADVSKELGSQQEQGGPDVKQQIAQMARKGQNPNAAAAMTKMFPQPPAGGGGAPSMPGMAA